jgi:heat shock protein HslJ
MGLVGRGSAGGAPVLGGTVWQLSEFVGGDDEVVAPDQPGNYTIKFNEDGNANIGADCNNVSATFASNDPELAIELGASTLVACDEASISNRFTGWLENTVSFVMDGDDLVLSLFADAGAVRFTSGGGA